MAIASEDFRRYLADLGVEEKRIVDFPNWSHLGATTADRTAIRERLGWPEDRTVVLHAGNMGLKQGLEQVVEAARHAAAIAFPVVFVLMGDGSQRAALEARARGVGGLQFLPFQPEGEVPDILAAADVLLVSERATVIDMSLPSKLTSYFAAGRPVLAAVPPGGSTAREVLRSGGGLVVPVGDPHELNRVVSRLREDPEWAGELGAAGRRYAESSLSLASAHTRIDRLLELTLGRNGR